MPSIYYTVFFPAAVIRVIKILSNHPRPAGPKPRGWQPVATGGFPCEMPLAFLTLKPLGRCCAPPTKKPPAWATVWVFPRNSLLWLRSTKNLEPISSVMVAEPCRLSPNACGRTRPLAPPEKPPFDSFFEIPPAVFFFFS